MNIVLQKTFYRSRRVRETLKRGSWILPSIFSVILFSIAIWGIDNFNQLLLYDDEFGYWAASAYLTGTDWKSVTSNIPYYSYGYGFLILTPIRLLMSTPEEMYKAAIVANALLLVGSYWIARNVVHQLFEDAKWSLIDVICFVVMLYPSNIVFSHIAWAECPLVFAFWVFVWLSLRAIKSPSLLNHIGLAVIAMVLYVVHQRTIAVAISTVMIMAWCFCVDKKRRKEIIAFAVAMAVLIVIHVLIKNDLINEFYNNNAKVKVNNFEGHTDKLTELFLGDGIVGLTKSMLGKWFYLFVATFMMAWWGAEFLFKKAGLYLKDFFGSAKKKKKDVPAPNNELIWYLWLLLAFGGNFFITSLFMNGGTRNDMLVYGRYNEYMIGIYFIIGIMAFLKDKNWGYKIMAYIPITVVCAWICQKITDGLGITAYQAYHSVCTSLHLQKGESPSGGIISFAIAGLFISILLVQIIKFNFTKISPKIKAGLVAVLSSVFFVYTAYSMVFGVMTEKQLLRIINIQNLVGWVELLGDDTGNNVYYCSDTEARYWSESFQFLLADTPLTVIKSNEINLEEDAFYIVGNEFLQRDGFDNQYYCVKESYQFALIVKQDGMLAQEAREIKGE
ncbi:MAG: hypothetical protein K2G45_01560 [Lachnospiraceae bacterium]|nr:hypothetical protein [Lachnospiraceae bacterium]